MKHFPRQTQYWENWTGVIRISARDLNALMEQNFQTTFSPQFTKGLEAISDQSEYPGIERYSRISKPVLFGNQPVR